MDLQLETAKDTINMLKANGYRFIFNAFDDQDSYQVSGHSYNNYMRSKHFWISFSCIDPNKLPIAIVPKTKDEEFMYSAMLKRLRQYTRAEKLIEDYLWAENLLNDYERNGYDFQYLSASKNGVTQWLLLYRKPNGQSKRYGNVGHYATPHECCVNTMDYLENKGHQEAKQEIKEKEDVNMNNQTVVDALNTLDDYRKQGWSITSEDALNGSITSKVCLSKADTAISELCKNFKGLTEMYLWLGKMLPAYATSHLVTSNLKAETKYQALLKKHGYASSIEKSKNGLGLLINYGEEAGWHDSSTIFIGKERLGKMPVQVINYGFTYLTITQQQWLMNSIFNYAKHLNLIVDFVADED